MLVKQMIPSQCTAHFLKILLCFVDYNINLAFAVTPYDAAGSFRKGASWHPLVLYNSKNPPAKLKPIINVI